MKGCCVSIFENLKHFVKKKPPLVLFLVVLVIFSLITMSIGAYVKTAQLKSTDIKKDWNIFLNGFSRVSFCLSSNSSLSPNLSTTDKSATNYTSKNITIPLKITVQPSPSFVHQRHNLTILSGLLSAHDIGIKGSNAMLEVFTELPHVWTSSDNGDEVCKDDVCPPVTLFACVTIADHSSLFPTSNIPPGTCKPTTNNTSLPTNAIFKSPHSSTCKSGESKIKFEHKLDPLLTIYLSLSDKQVINLHLLHTSIILFAIILTIFLFALFRGKRKTNVDGGDDYRGGSGGGDYAVKTEDGSEPLMFSMEDMD
ncbi:hypothetical protein HELRODRAFT_185894 [Helobdella robusta]|uniref:TMEM248/TMEM219 domain-containing protein n=1 Tax=Helobdella robusta TaxID=6412 RepID=T1FNE7_HELRO|nr:hypothetical protein HELRODRAFT_185894 [Helobdella robusta]ESN97747.1 hypothetical protein HELRODRAFT_185894 [Helobdella robusta]